MSWQTSTVFWEWKHPNALEKCLSWYDNIFSNEVGWFKIWNSTSRNPKMALFVQNIFIEKVILKGGEEKRNEPVEPAAETDIIERNQFLTGFQLNEICPNRCVCVCVCSAVVVKEGVKFVSFDDCVKEVQGRKCYPLCWLFLNYFFFQVISIFWKCS